MSPQNDWTLRFQSESRFEGPVEVVRNGLWGPVCGDSLEWNEAVVVCRHMGLPGGRVGRSIPITEHRAFTGTMDCVGSELSLDDCTETEESAWTRCTTQAYIICGRYKKVFAYWCGAVS